MRLCDFGQFSIQTLRRTFECHSRSFASWDFSGSQSLFEKINLLVEFKKKWNSKNIKRFKTIINLYQIGYINFPLYRLIIGTYQCDPISSPSLFLFNANYWIRTFRLWRIIEAQVRYLHITRELIHCRPFIWTIKKSLWLNY